MPQLERRRLGRTGIDVSALGLGAMDTPGSPDGRAVVERALDLGIDFIDTARDYEGSEFLIGQVVRERGGTGFHVASKTFSHSADGSQRDVDRSRSFLGLERITLYQLHDISTPAAWAEVTADGGALEGLRIAQARGLIAHIGISCHGLDVARLAIESGAFDTVMLEYSAFSPESRPLIELAAARDVGVIVMRPLGGSGRTSTMRGRIAAGYDGPLTPANLLRYALAPAGVSVVIPGARHASRIEDNVATALHGAPLDAAEARALEAEARRYFSD